MTTGYSSDERRHSPRFDGSQVAVVLRPRGRLAAVAAHAVDFNRHGIAVHTPVPLTKDRLVYLSLRCGGIRVDNLVGVVHNCVRQGSKFRSGIRFRPTSGLQHDKRQVEEVLAFLESSLGVSREANV
jgi:hypothetical protein